MIDLPLHTNVEITKRIRFGLAAIISLATALRGFYLHAPLSGVNLVYLNGKPGQSGLVQRNGWRAHAYTLDHSYGSGIFKRHWRPMISLLESSDSIEMVQAIKGQGRAHGILRGLQTCRLTWPLEKSSSKGLLREQE